MRHRVIMLTWAGLVPEAFAASVTAPAANLDLDPFYSRCVLAEGLPVVSSGQTSEAALLAAEDIVRNMLGPRPDVREALRGAGIRVAVIAVGERTTDLPEYRDLLPKARWVERTRGLGATRDRPVVSCGEENLLGLQGDPYFGESLLIHELAHAIHEIGLAGTDFEQRLRRLYEEAMAQGLWKRACAAHNLKEYWAEGVQAFFDANLRSVPPNGIHNHVWNRETLEAYDPALAALVGEVFRDSPWRWRRPPPVAAVTAATWKVRIEGSREFQAAVCKALHLLQTKSPRSYGTVDAYVGVVKEAPRSGMRAYLKPPALEIAKPTWSQSEFWLAGVIAHDAHHAKLYHDYKKKHNDHVPDDAWVGQTAELACIAVQIQALEEIGAPQSDIDYCRALDGTHGGNSTISDYRKRNW